MTKLVPIYGNQLSVVATVCSRGGGDDTRRLRAARPLLMLVCLPQTRTKNQTGHDVPDLKKECSSEGKWMATIIETERTTYED